MTEIIETDDEGNTEVHRVGLCVGTASYLFWVSGLCICLSVTGVSHASWVKGAGLFDLPDIGAWLTIPVSYSC